ncbi:MAG: hypothetical protein IT366_13495 [Candidatus Hydrogenedentes bacterium]|nr:hypothetical protein [Candidatus Hydrogenedentota bacterium]
MKTRSVLLYYPGFPFDPDVLTPSRPLAATAAVLLEQGHETRILDFGTAETVARLVRGKASARLERIADQDLAQPSLNPLQTLHTLWHMRGADRSFREQRSAYAREIAAQVTSIRGLHFAAFMMESIDDVISTLAIVRPLREYCPRLRIVGFGAITALFPESLLNERNAFDCLCIEDSETALAALAERIDTPQLWAAIPNLAFMRSGGIYLSPRDTGGSLSALSSPAYEPDAYPALRTEQKIRVFSIDECRPSAAYSHACAQTAAETPRVRSVASVCNEMWRIGTLFGARAFHFTGEAAPASHVSAVAHELMRRGMSTIYTRSVSISHAVPATFPGLATSGCVALSFPIDTGSQRLLDTYYGREFTITDVERVLRCAKSIGLHAIARFTYPTPEDDYHTRAETLRIIERNKPYAAPISFPSLRPGSRWFSDTGMGYNVEPERYYYQSMTTARKFPVFAHAGHERYRGANLSECEAAALRQALVTDVERLGVNASTPDEIVRLSCVMGSTGREHEFAARVQRDFARGDAMGIATLVDLVNEVACVSAKRMALRAHDTERLAVGN